MSEEDSVVYDDTQDQMVDEDIVTIPYTEKNGVKYVNVSVNGFGFEMIFDTGCSNTSISVAEANYLYQKGFLTCDDILGVAYSQIADGGIVENMVINLKEVIIADEIRCTDVVATVSANNNAPLLLGNEVLNRVAAYAVDNDNKVINFKLRR
ncbi:MAG: retroviral-like aspartic protease family protein [Bacteroidaceae bacterium]|nr:retroviral-like aspartic protease family protein [Bacteroidaceae bacterium]